MTPAPDYADIAGRAAASGIMVTAAGVEEIAGMLATPNNREMRDALAPWADHHGPLPEYDHPAACVFDSGVQYAVELLAKELDVTDWTPCDGTEEYDGDLGGTLMNIVRAAMPKDQHGDPMDPIEVRAALQPPPASNGGEISLRPMSEAPRDRSMILARYNPPEGHHEARFKGRWFSVWHEGVTDGGFDMGWALYPGYGGVSDRNFDGWLPLPDAALPLSPRIEQAVRSRDESGSPGTVGCIAQQWIDEHAREAAGIYGPDRCEVAHEPAKVMVLYVERKPMAVATIWRDAMNFAQMVRWSATIGNPATQRADTVEQGEQRARVAPTDRENWLIDCLHYSIQFHIWADATREQIAEVIEHINEMSCWDDHAAALVQVPRGITAHEAQEAVDRALAKEEG